MSEVNDKSIPIKPPMDMWIGCPTCGHDPDFWDCGGLEWNADETEYKWVGPSFCPKCGQAFDLSELNVPWEPPAQASQP